MTKGFVFGKFLPFHKGHEALLKFALEKVDYLEVLVCKSDQEKLSGKIRQEWIQTVFQDYSNIHVRVFEYQEKEYPNTSVSSWEVSQIWANVFKTLFPDVDYVITSEKYGDFLAEIMQIKHICFDQPRNFVPIAASLIKNDLVHHWDFLPQVVQKYYAKKVVLLGTESTGKTTLTQKLATYFNCPYVLEAGRDLIPNSNRFEISDLYAVINEHSKRIQEATKNIPVLTIIDTDHHITMSYAQFFFDQKLELPKELPQADLYLFLDNDVQFIQDGTRLEEAERNNLHFHHKQIVEENLLPCIFIDGEYEARFQKATKAITTLITNEF